MTLRIAVLGEHRPGYEPQEATVAALGHAAAAQGRTVDAVWVSSAEVDEATLDGIHGVFLSPGDCYLDLDAALGVVQACLDLGIPLTGTCSGFQHAMVALARAAGIADATHEEYGMAGTAVVTRLTCSLAGTQGEVRIEPGTLAHQLAGSDRLVEEHRCNYGLDADFMSVLDATGAIVSGRGDDGTPRVVEIPTHPFFLVTLFLPQLASRPGAPHPLIGGFLAATAAAPRPARRSRSS